MKFSKWISRISRPMRFIRERQHFRAITINFKHGSDIWYFARLETWKFLFVCVPATEQQNGFLVTLSNIPSKNITSLTTSSVTIFISNRSKKNWLIFLKYCAQTFFQMLWKLWKFCSISYQIYGCGSFSHLLSSEATLEESFLSGAVT